MATSHSLHNESQNQDILYNIQWGKVCTREDFEGTSSSGVSTRTNSTARNSNPCQSCKDSHLRCEMSADGICKKCKARGSACRPAEKPALKALMRTHPVVPGQLIIPSPQPKQGGDYSLAPEGAPTERSGLSPLSATSESTLFELTTKY